MKFFCFLLGERDPVRVTVPDPPSWEHVTVDPIIHDATRYVKPVGDVIHGQFVRELQLGCGNAMLMANPPDAIDGERVALGSPVTSSVKQIDDLGVGVILG